ncbi:MAG: DUF2357 domain-containing protein [Bacilli bacterium]|nr:DUF2357 domain-containing protein [Bacilli bacterium]
MGRLKIQDLIDSTSDKKKDKFTDNIRSNLFINADLNKVEADFEWLDIMEDTIRYLDNILRNPNRFIINEEEIVKIELARRITVESIRHLSKHTNYIQKIEDNGDVKPSKILNTLKDESFDTYENRLIYTLIDNMRNFLEIKKKSLITESSLKDIKKAKYSARSNVGKEKVFIEVNYTSSLVDKNEPKGEVPVAQRIQRLDDDISMLMNSDVYKTLRKLHVARVIPPIKKTNVILKNTNFQYAMKLWDYLQTHVADDTKEVKYNKKYEENGILKEYMNNTFLLDFLAMDTLSEVDSKEKEVEVIEQITDNLIQRIVELNADLPLTTLKEKIGDKIAVVKYKKEATLAEIQNTISTHIKSYLEKIENIEL